MESSRYALAAVALLCVLAIGTSATSLESTVTTDPADEIDIDWDRLPIGQSTAADIRDDIQDGHEDGDGGVDATDSGVEREAETGSGTGQGSGVDELDGAERDGGTSQDGDAGRDGGAGSDADGPGTTTALPTVWDLLWSLLAALLRVLIPVVVLLALAALAYRYRRRISSLLGRTATPDVRGPESVDRWPDREPSTAVDQAWVRMVRRVDPARPATMTTTECAVAAREAGLDADAVELITSAFERVHYGGEPPAAVADSARTGLQRLGEHGETTGDARTDGSFREDDR
ncbi:DUF4129 domain-containing protein [Halorubrum sp. DTA98]|uniref:DUF4129 domain-containing protein n=1 Tax=Halorubrum sp. DTA98 TaxID=3402163 RepID=UPI003AAE5075